MNSSFDDLLAEFTPQELAAALTVNYQTAAAMKRRGSVAPHHWERLIAALGAKGKETSHRELARLHTRRAKYAPDGASAE